MVPICGCKGSAYFFAVQMFRDFFCFFSLQSCRRGQSLQSGWSLSRLSERISPAIARTIIAAAIMYWIIVAMASRGNWRAGHRALPPE